MSDAFDTWWFADGTDTGGHIDCHDGNPTDIAQAAWNASRAALKAEVLAELRVRRIGVLGCVDAVVAIDEAIASIERL